MRDKLTGRQAAFVREYLVDYSAKQAAIRAGYKPKYAAVQAYQNMQKPMILAAIQERIMGIDEALLRISDIARSDVGDFLDEAGQVDLNNAAGKTKLIRRVKVRSSVTATGAETEETEIELYSALDALEKIGRFHKLFTERLEHSGPDGQPISIIEIVKDYGGSDA